MILRQDFDLFIPLDRREKFRERRSFARGAVPRVEAELLCNYIIAREHSLSMYRYIYIAQFKWPIVEGCPSASSGIIMRNECETPFAEG
uniref:Uncharacterized protein n=1 Tax=Trichogramma kaykai TaxID=54128 RepID=A0ABD2XMT4_9HYME